VKKVEKLEEDSVIYWKRQGRRSFEGDDIMSAAGAF
jgi:hypothetical protein